MWTEKTGVLQTELEALIEDKPEEMERMARDAIAPFYDPTLAERVTRARERWEREAQALIDARTAKTTNSPACGPKRSPRSTGSGVLPPLFRRLPNQV